MTRPSHTTPIPTLSDLLAAVHSLGLEGQEDATVGGARESQLSDAGTQTPLPAPPPVVLVTQVVQWRRS
jgi:hypothetical protein